MGYPFIFSLRDGGGLAFRMKTSEVAPKIGTDSRTGVNRNADPSIDVCHSGFKLTFGFSLSWFSREITRDMCSSVRR
jgi:hypothetical protein